jgi:hypothetical protein
MNEPLEEPLAGCCGLYCGLCPRYQSKAPSRCPSCHQGEHHSYCGVWRCCVGKHGHHTCADCEEYLCERLTRALGVGREVDSFISYKPAVPNLERIRAVGLSIYLEEQRERLRLVESLLESYNEGRSMSFYCRATALMPPELVRQAMADHQRLVSMGEVDGSDLRASAKAMRSAIQDLATQASIDLRLRREKKTE